MATLSARHDHFDTVGEDDAAGHVGGPEVELGTVVAEEGSVASALVLGENVDLGLELLVRGDGAGFGNHLAALDFFLLGSPEEETDVVAGLALVEEFPEHLDIGDGGFGGVADSHDFHFFIFLTIPRSIRPVATVPRPSMENTSSMGMRKSLIDGALGKRDVFVDSLDQLEDGFPCGRRLLRAP